MITPSQRRRRGILLALLVFFFVLLMFDTPSDQSDKEKEKEIQAQMNEKRREVPNIFKDEELDSLKRVLENLDSGTHFPTEIKGEFTGEWGGEIMSSVWEQL